MTEPRGNSLQDLFLHRVRGVGIFVFWALIFGIAYTQAPLYYSNQNQYFLHGLAQAGRGCLDQDWLANTRDPAPVFSALVALTARFLHESCFYGYYLLLLGFYFQQMVGIYDRISEDRADPRTRLVFITLLVAVHAGVIRLASAQLFGVDYPWYFQAGVAGQYLLGFGLQPSVAGVFLMASVHAYGRGQSWRGTLWACLAGILHGTYLLGAAMLVLANLGLQLRERRVRAACMQGLAALALVAPVVIYNGVMFAPTSPGAFAEAQRILAHERIPHHAEPQRWCDGIALGQLAWIVLSLVLVRGHRLLVFLLIPLVLSLVLTLIQLGTGNDTLALLFPWRITAVLVPLATTLLLGKLVNRLARVWTNHAFGAGRMLPIVCGIVLGLLAAGGIAIPWFELGYRSNPTELALMEFVRSQDCRDAVYLLPVELPRVGAGAKGAASTNFTPAPRAGQSGHLIAIDLQRFRLDTGTPIYVDFKSIPYQDVEVLEWYRRLRWAQTRYAQKDWHEASVHEELIQAGITHIVTPSGSDSSGRALERIYQDASYHLYRVRSRATE